MPDFAVKTKFSAIDGVSGSLDKMGRSVREFGSTAEREMNRAGGAFARVKQIAAGVTLGNIATRAAEGLGDFIVGIKDAAKESAALKTAYKSVFTSDATAQMKFAADVADRLGLDLRAASMSYMQISAAAKGSAISNAMVKDVFIGVSMGATALQLTAEQTEGALTALSQMISKGKVSAEELRGQLGERLPGAFQIAARAMNMSTAELDKFMASGNLTAEEFIPKFAAQMNKEFGPAAEAAAREYGAMENRFNTASRNFKIAAGTLVLPAIGSIMEKGAALANSVTKWLSDPTVVKVFSAIGSVIGAVASVLPAVIVGIAGYAAALGVMKTVQMGILALGWIKYLWMMSEFITVATIKQWLLNIALNANPIGLICIAIGVLIGLGYTLYKNWDVVKNFFIGMWQAIGHGWDWLKNKFFENLPVIKNIGLVMLAAFMPIVGIPLLIAKNWDFVIAKISAAFGWISKGAAVAAKFFGIGTMSEAPQTQAPNEAEARARVAVANSTNVNTTVTAPDGYKVKTSVSSAPRVTGNMGANI